MQENNKERIESEAEVKAYIKNLKYAIDTDAEISIQYERQVDNKRNEKYTNKYTLLALFPDENPIDALKRELKTLTVEEYIKTVKDIRFPQKKEMREFGKVYNGKDEIYIKIRVELLNNLGNTTTFVMSFHFAEKPFASEVFPYKK